MKKYSDFETNGGNPGGILETFWLWETYAGVQQQGERYGHLVPTHVTDTSMWNNSARSGALKTDFCPQTRAAAARRPASERLWERYRGSCRGEGTGPAPEEGRARCAQSRGATALPLPRAPAPHATPRTRPTRAPLPRLPPPPPEVGWGRAQRAPARPAGPACTASAITRAACAKRCGRPGEARSGPPSPAAGGGRKGGGKGRGRALDRTGAKRRRREPHSPGSGSLRKPGRGRGGGACAAAEDGLGCRPGSAQRRRTGPKEAAAGGAGVWAGGAAAHAQGGQPVPHTKWRA